MIQNYNSKRTAKDSNREIAIWLAYSIMFYVICLPLHQFVASITYAIVLGFFAGELNSILSAFYATKMTSEEFDKFIKMTEAMQDIQAQFEKDSNEIKTQLKENAK